MKKGPLYRPKTFKPTYTYIKIWRFFNDASIFTFFTLFDNGFVNTFKNKLIKKEYKN